MTKISWTDKSWNPVTGCTPVSGGCAHCYAKRWMRRWGMDFSKVKLHPDRLEKPLRWKKPRMVFVPSMGDLFHEDVPDEFIQSVFNTMWNAPRHTFQILTKRPQRMRDYLNAHRTWWGEYPQWGHVWLGVSVENQARADERIPLLLETPAAVRFVSAEPLLGPLDLTPWLPHLHTAFTIDADNHPLHALEMPAVNPMEPHAHGPGLDWCIVGGESGGPPERRLVERCDCGVGPIRGVRAEKPYPDSTHTVNVRCRDCQQTGWRPKPEALEWVRDIRDQCQATGVAFWFKQWGPRAGQGTLVDGQEHKEMPEVRA